MHDPDEPPSYGPRRYDPELLNFMLGGKRPKWRRERRDPSKTPTEITSAETCEDEYQRLLWQQHRFATLEDLRLEVFNWGMAGVSYDDAVAWYRQGAGWSERHLLFKLAGAGITPDDTAKWWSYSQRGPNITIMDALLADQATVVQVRELKRREAQ